MLPAGLAGALEIIAVRANLKDLGPYNVNTQKTRNRFWDGHDQMIRDDISTLKGNHLFQFGGTYQHNWDHHQRTDNGGGINNQIVYELGDAWWIGTCVRHTAFAQAGRSPSTAALLARRPWASFPSPRLPIPALAQI